MFFTLWRPDTFARWTRHLPSSAGAAPHDIHHYKPRKNYGFVFIIWDRLFDSFEPCVSPEEAFNPYVPPFNKERRRRPAKTDTLAAANPALPVLLARPALAAKAKGE